MGANVTDNNPISSFSVVFAGGGCRTFWALGAYEALADILPAVDEWAGVSAGSAMAVFAAAGSAEAAMGAFLRLTDENERNVYPGRLFGPGRVFPHEDIYRSAIAAALSGDAMGTLRRAGPARIFLAWVEAEQPKWRTGLGATVAYNGRKKRGELHGPEQPFPGLGCGVVTAQDAPDAQTIVEWVLRSSTSPPVTEIPEEDGRHFVDGGLVDNVPLRALSSSAQGGRVFSLLSRPIPPSGLPRSSSRFYLQPSAPVPIHKWDYTRPDMVQATYDMGKRDGEKARSEVASWIAR
jgi:predicted acylesterase/phospholipase RssA